MLSNMSINITPTIPPALELLKLECKQRGLDKTTKKPLDPEKYFMVLFKEGKPGIIGMEPIPFIKKYWVGKALVNPQMEVTFVGWYQTVNGKLEDLVTWAQA